MVNGFDSFREKFKGYGDCYTIIGGTACDILMNEAGLVLRAKSPPAARSMTPRDVRYFKHWTHSSRNNLDPSAKPNPIKNSRPDCAQGGLACLLQISENQRHKIPQKVF